MPSAKVTIREADPSDVSAVVELLRLRDERQHPAESVAAYVCGLDPSRLRAWLAFADGKPAGMTTVYLRKLRCGDRRYNVGYWAHLFIRAEYRRLMIYPQLVLTMMKGARAAGLDLVCCVMRRDDVTTSHLKIGFCEIGSIPVLMRPLRPARLITKYKQLGRVAMSLGSPLDALYQSRLRRPRSHNDLSVESLDLCSSDMHELVDMLNTSGRNRISQVWTTESLRSRFGATIEGWPYTLLAAMRGENLVAAVVFRVAERGNAIRAGVMMDAVAVPAGESALRLLLAEAQQRAIDANCDLMLYLDGLGNETGRVVAASGYRRSPETYRMIVWPKDRIEHDKQLADLTQWRFAFADHDAF